jgi:hypothetical protein
MITRRARRSAGPFLTLTRPWGRPVGTRNRQPAPRYDVGKIGTRDRARIRDDKVTG